MCIRDRVKQPLVPLLHRRQQHVPVDVPGQPREVRHQAIHELARRGEAVGEQPSQRETVTVSPAEGNGPVERLVAEDVEAALHAGPRMAWTIATTTGPQTVRTMLPIAS